MIAEVIGAALSNVTVKLPAPVLVTASGLSPAIEEVTVINTIELAFAYAFVMLALRLLAAIVPVPTGPLRETPPTSRAAVLPEATESIRPVEAEEVIVVAPFDNTLRTVCPEESFAAMSAFPVPDAVFCATKAALPATELVALIAVPPEEVTVSALFAED